MRGANDRTNWDRDDFAPLDGSHAPAVVRLQSTIVTRSFWAKIGDLAAGAPFAEDALALWYCALDRRTPRATKALLFTALTLFVLPRRLSPHRRAGRKLVDDAAVIGAAIATLGRAIQPEHRAKARGVLDAMTVSQGRRVPSSKAQA